VSGVDIGKVQQNFASRITIYISQTASLGYQGCEKNKQSFNLVIKSCTSNKEKPWISYTVMATNGRASALKSRRLWKDVQFVNSSKDYPANHQTYLCLKALMSAWSSISWNSTLRLLV
jgi:hypothetical protein